MPVVPGLGQDLKQPPKQSSAPLTAASDADIEVLKKDLLRIQLEMSQIAPDMEAIDSRMMREVAERPLNRTSKTLSQARELLKDHNPHTAVKIFFDSPRSDLKWESCLKTSKLYMGLVEKILEMDQGRLPGNEENRSIPTIAGEPAELAQLAFLARMLTELELRHSELQSQLMSPPDLKQQEQWSRLREAVQNDDRTYLERLNALLARIGVSPQRFATTVVSEAQKTSQNSVAAVIEGMQIVSPEVDGWRLAEIPGINPDFIRAVECEREAMKTFRAARSNSALAQVCRCRKYEDGSYILAFAAKAADPARSIDPVGKPQLTLDGRPLDSGAIHLAKKDLTQDPPNPDSAVGKGGGDHHQGENENTTFGVTDSVIPRPKIPSWWIRCACPEDHPNAGMVVDGVRWHAPVLQCPNPELRLRELLK